MRRQELSDLIRLPEKAAVRRYFDGKNFEILRWGLALMTPTAFGVAIAFLAQGKPVMAALWTGLLALNVGLVLSRRKRFFATWAREILLLYLVAHFLVILPSFPDRDPAIAFGTFVFPVLLILFRLRTWEYASLLLLFGSGAVYYARPQGELPSLMPMILGAAGTVCVIVFVLAVLRTRQLRDRFLIDWRREAWRERERSRMQTELDDARAIQLSMLPHDSPELSWLEFAGVSLPASEVGGDYYQYFELDGERLAVVIGDVAGHGMASGLVLSGVRSGLYLLRDRLDDPVDVLSKLNTMLRDTSPGRLFVTLQIVLLDPERGEVRVANAGHPALLHISGRDAASVGGSGLPLGTRLEPEFKEEVASVRPGDSLLLYTDGLIELRDFRGEALGASKLARKASRAARTDSARLMRDSLLSDISRYKGDVEQEDDITLVALRVKEPV
jgi:hypothetical protein